MDPTQQACLTVVSSTAADPARPFDFLIDGELLRLSLLKHLQAKQISTVSPLAKLAAASVRLGKAPRSTAVAVSSKSFTVYLATMRTIVRVAELQEAVLEVEYVPAVLPPRPQEEHPHDDW